VTKYGNTLDDPENAFSIFKELILLYTQYACQLFQASLIFLSFFAKNSNKPSSILHLKASRALSKFIRKSLPRKRFAGAATACAQSSLLFAISDQQAYRVIPATSWILSATAQTSPLLSSEQCNETSIKSQFITSTDIKKALNSKRLNLRKRSHQTVFKWIFLKW